MPAKITSKLKHNLLTIAIAIIFALFVGYGIDTFYESPEYDDYCEDKYEYSPDIYDTKEKCEQAEGTWLGEVGEIKDTVRLVRTQSCDFTSYYKQCREEFDLVIEPYERDIFIITLIIGLLAVLVGGVVLQVESVSSGIMGGGILTIIYGTIRFWGDMSKYLRFTILTIVLIVLIWIGYKKFKK